jgi:hypothetical protein
VRDRKRGTITNGDSVSGGRERGRKYTMIRCHVGGGAQIHVAHVMSRDLQVAKHGDEGRAQVVRVAGAAWDRMC